MAHRRIWLAMTGGLILGLFSSAVAQKTLIVETEQGGQNVQFYSEVSGSWEHSVAKSTASGIQDPSIGSRFEQVNSPPEDGEVKVSPVLPAAGEYEVSVTWGRSANARNVKYVVEAPGVSKTVYLDQDGWGGGGAPNANQWHSLGTYQLPVEGTVVRVQIDESDGPMDAKNAHRIYSDAFRFAPPGSGDTVGRASAAPSAGGSPFGSIAPSTMFSAPQGAAPSAAGSPFGSVAQPATSSPFGPASAAPPQATTSPFGQAAPPAASGLPFGAPAQSSPFGSPATASAAQPAVGSTLPFGTGPAAGAATSPFATGQAGAPVSSSPFAAGPSAAPAASSPFATGPAAAPAPSSSPFAGGPGVGAASSSPFAAAAPGASSPFASGPGAETSSPFGGSAAAAPGQSSPFGGAPSAAPASSPFAASPQPGTGYAAAPATQPGYAAPGVASGYGYPAPGMAAAPGGSPFASQPSAASSPFAGGMSQPAGTAYAGYAAPAAQPGQSSPFAGGMAATGQPTESGPSPFAGSGMTGMQQPSQPSTGGFPGAATSAGSGVRSPFAGTSIPAAPAIPTAAPASQAPKWVTYQEAIALGKQLNRPIILYFAANTSAVKKFEQEVLDSPQAQQALAKFVLARIGFPESTELVRYYGVVVSPTLIFLGPDGYTRSRIDGVQPAQTLLTEMSRYAR